MPAELRRLLEMELLMPETEELIGWMVAWLYGLTNERVERLWATSSP